MAAQKKPTPKKKPNPNARGTKKPAERPAEKPAERQQEPPKPPQDTANQFWSIMLFALGVLSLLLIVIPGTSAWHVLHTTMFGLFGVASAFIPLILVYTAILIGMERSHQTVSGKAFWGVALMILSSAIVQIFFYGEVRGDGLVDCVRTLFRQGKDLQGGGVFSALIAWPLIRLFDVTGAKIIILLMLFVFVMLLTNTGLIDLFRLLSRPFRSMHRAVRQARYDDQYLDAYDEMLRSRTAREEREAIAMANAEQPRRTRASRAKDFRFDVPIVDNAPVPEDLPQPDSPQWERERRSGDPVPEQPEPEIQKSQESAELDDLVAAATAVKEPKRTKKEEQAAQTEAMTAEIEAEVVNGEAQTPVYEYRLPPIDYLEPSVSKAADPNAALELRQNADILVDTLNSFGVQVRITGINRGPTVTRYEVQPSAGVKIAKITSLADDIALNLAAGGVRIEAPIPGKPAVGIEVANAHKDMVGIREILESRQFTESKSKLSFAVGKDIDGNIILGDIAKMPHMIIAGATGSGKSVCTNGIIMSILYHAKPTEVKLVLIDPKIVEFKIYDGIPHLLIPVVTDPRKAAGALNWATQEMDRRYALCASYNVRDLKDFNALAARREDLDPLPQIVIVIDEFADLMMTSSKEVEDAVCRIAQKARAAGMHLIIATQRPTADVITGLIKSNVPSRIALSVKSQMDSRNILDVGGAEKLLGHGDMLYFPNGLPKPVRVQGCYCSTEEIERVVGYIKEEAKAEYSHDIMEAVEQSMPAVKGERFEDDGSDRAEGDDELIDRAIDVVVELGQASTSSLQRKLKLGYARAARIMDELEEMGVIGPHEGAKPRKVLISPQQAAERRMRRQESN